MSGSGNSQLSGTNRHVECADCHNAHSSTNALPRIQGTNLISGVLAGVWGVDAASPGDVWSDPSTWTWSKKSPATAEYQICFKCHSAAAYGSNPPSEDAGRHRWANLLEQSHLYRSVAGVQPEQSELSHGLVRHEPGSEHRHQLHQRLDARQPDVLQRLSQVEHNRRLPRGRMGRPPRGCLAAIWRPRALGTSRAATAGFSMTTRLTETPTSRSVSVVTATRSRGRASPREATICTP